MFSKNHIINIISIFVIALINSTYMLVFSRKTFFSPVLLSFTFLLLFLFLVKSFDRFELFIKGIISKNALMTLFILISLFLGIASILFSGKLPLTEISKPGSGNLRFQFAINSIQVYKYSFLNYDNLKYFRNILGIIGLLSTGFLIINKSDSVKLISLQVFIFVISPVIYLGVILQGELLFLISLISFIIIFAESKKNIQDSLAFLIIGAAVSGMVLFLNLSAIIPVLILGFYFYRYHIIKALAYLLISTIVFFILDYLFIASSNTYSGIGNIIWIIIVFTIISIYAGWSVSNIFEVFFSSGVLTFLFLITLSLTDLIHFGAVNIFNSMYGLNILLYCIPVIFLTFSLHEYSIDRFLGKVITSN